MNGTDADDRLLLHNGAVLNGRSGAGPRWNHEGRSARPVGCSAWLGGMSMSIIQNHVKENENKTKTSTESRL